MPLPESREHIKMLTGPWDACQAGAPQRGDLNCTLRLERQIGTPYGLVGDRQSSHARGTGCQEHASSGASYFAMPNARVCVGFGSALSFTPRALPSASATAVVLNTLREEPSLKRDQELTRVPHAIGGHFQRLKDCVIAY